MCLSPTHTHTYVYVSLSLVMCCLINISNYRSTKTLSVSKELSCVCCHSQFLFDMFDMM